MRFTEGREVSSSLSLPVSTATGVQFQAYTDSLLAILTALWVRRVEAEHEAHEAHIKEEHGGELPPTPGYDYLNKRAKPFPWGMNSLFYNPHVRLYSTISALLLKKVHSGQQRHE